MDLDNSCFNQLRHCAMQGGPGQPAVVDQLGLAALDLTLVIGDAAEHGV